MKIIEAKVKEHIYEVYGTGLKLRKKLDGGSDETITLGDIKILDNGRKVTDFGESFSGYKFDAEDAAKSIILGYINNDTTIDAKVITPDLAGFRDWFVLDNRLELDEGKGERIIPKRYITERGYLNIELVTNAGGAFYTDGEAFIAVYPDGSLATDMEAFYFNAICEAVETKDYCYIAKGVAEIVKEMED